MKLFLNTFYSLLIVVLCSFSVKETQLNNDLQLRKLEHHAFQDGEKLTFRIHYGLINAGTATLEINKLTDKINDRDILHIVGTGVTNSSFDWMFKVRDRYETYLDEAGVFPWKFVRDIDENGYTTKQLYKFEQNHQQVITEKGQKFETPNAVQDMLSSFYYARTIDFSKAKIGEVYTINSFVDEKNWPLKIKFAGREILKTNGKKYNTLVFHPVIQTGRMFKNAEDVTVWVSDDANKIPLLAQGKIWVGSIKMEITNYEGLANPIAEIK